ncbi:MAG: response regulator transcription factor [Patescibacteria group bacterium]
MAKILLVDDDPLLIRMYQKKFELDGHQVITASDGNLLFDQLNNFKPEVILLDVMMPELNGLETLKKLKADEKHKSIPVVMLTNVGSSEKDSEAALEAGAVAYLVKASYTPKEIVQKVNEIISGYTHEVLQVKTKIKPASNEDSQHLNQDKIESDKVQVTVEDL